MSLRPYCCKCLSRVRDSTVNPRLSLVLIRPERPEPISPQSLTEMEPAAIPLRLLSDPMEWTQQAVH